MPRELRLSTALGPAYPEGKAGEAWASLIRERSGGAIPVRHFPGGALSQRDPAREFAALREGAIDLAVGSAQSWSVQIPELNVFALPWLIRSDAALEALVGASAVRERLAARLESVGVVAVEWAANGFVELATRAAVHQPADLSGLKIRVQVTSLAEDTLAALGAAPTAMSAAGARAALADGTLDGHETSVATYRAARSPASGLTHLLLWDAHADALIFAVNRRVWEAWSAAERELVRRAAKDASLQAAALAQRTAGDEALRDIAEQGAVVTRLTPTGKDAFQRAARAAYDRWAAVVGGDLVRAAEAAMAASNAAR